MRKVNKKYKYGDIVKVLILLDKPKEVKCEVVAEVKDNRCTRYILAQNNSWIMVPDYYLSYCNQKIEEEPNWYITIDEFLPELDKQVITTTNGTRYAVSELKLRKGYLPNVNAVSDGKGTEFKGVTTWDLYWDNLPLINMRKWINIPKEDIKDEPTIRNVQPK